MTKCLRRRRGRAASPRCGQVTVASPVPAVEAMVEAHPLTRPRAGEIPFRRQRHALQRQDLGVGRARHPTGGRRARCRHRARRMDAVPAPPAQRAVFEVLDREADREAGLVEREGLARAVAERPAPCRRSPTSWTKASSAGVRGRDAPRPRSRAQPSPCMGWRTPGQLALEVNDLVAEGETTVRDAIGKRHQRIAGRVLARPRGQCRVRRRAQQVAHTIRGANARSSRRPPAPDRRPAGPPAATKASHHPPSLCKLARSQITRKRIDVEHAEEAAAGRQGLRQRMAGDPRRLRRRDHGAMRLGQRHRRHAARRAGLPLDGPLLPGDGQASDHAAGARAVERARHRRQGAGRRRLGRHLPDGEHAGRSQGAGLLLRSIRRRASAPTARSAPAPMARRRPTRRWPTTRC